jgi:hypothetical protein
MAADGNAVVVPRVMPMFVHHVTTTPADRRAPHFDMLVSNVRQVFESRFEAPDVVEMLECVMRHCRSTAGLNRDVSQALRLRAVRALRALFADAEAYTPHTYKAIRTIAARVGAERAANRDALVIAFDREVRALEASQKDAAGNSFTSTKASSPTAAEASTAGGNSTAAPEEGSDDASASGSMERPRINAPLPDDPAVLQDHDLCLDEALEDPCCRGAVIELFTRWDAAMIDVSCFTASPQTLHVYLPFRMATPTRVYRDFITCTQRPKLTKPWGPSSFVHIKTNIKAQTDVMYRFLIEGYNYGVNAAIFNDVVGCTNRRWQDIGNMAKYGWPEGWDAAMTNDYAPGCAISQYYSRDRHLVIRLKAKSFFSVGFSVSAWLVFHGYGEGFPIAATIHHGDDDL